MRTIDEIKSTIEKIECLNGELDSLKQKRKALDFGGHQSKITANIAGVSVDVSFLGRGYSSKMIPGMDMVLLGMKKAINNIIDDKIKEIEEQKNLVVNLSKNLGDEYAR